MLEELKTGDKHTLEKKKSEVQLLYVKCYFWIIKWNCHIHQNLVDVKYMFSQILSDFCLSFEFSPVPKSPKEPNLD